MTTRVPRGRPRSSGSKHCDRCGRDVQKIRVHWPDGAICGICFTVAVRNFGACASCGDQRMLPGRTPKLDDICRDCAGITTELTCVRCGREAERFREGACMRCVLRDDLTAVLSPQTPPDLRLKRLIEILTESTHPESIYTWTRGDQAAALLQGLGDRSIPLTHAGFDALPQTRSVEFLRDLLVHHGMLPAREKQLATFERWVDDRIASFASTPTVQLPIAQFATMHHLSRLRTTNADETNMNFAVRSAKQEITEAGKLLIWLERERHHTYQDLRQEDLDDYLTSGPSTRYTIRTFLVWLQHQGGHDHLVVTHRSAQTTPMITQARRLELIRLCLDDEEIALSTRVAALVVLLFGTRIGSVASLRVSDLIVEPRGLYLRLGSYPAPLPAGLAEPFWKYRDHRPNQQTGNSRSQWLFPGTRAGQHIHPDSLMQSLWRNRLGADGQ